MSNPPSFNPLDKKNLGESVGLALSRCSPVALDQLPKFKGAGIYALYYSGDFGPYKILAKLNRPIPTIPIYVGKALPEGSRKGIEPKSSHESGKLRSRLNEHARSIRDSANLEVGDFVCRYLVVEETWISLCESLLIQTSTPLWNTVLDGFGRHVGGKNRKDGLSTWHAFHTGRDAQNTLEVSHEGLEKISANVTAFMARLGS